MFNVVRINKAPQLIISQIRKQIFEGKLLPGDKLPSERKLMEQFNVSKQTLREALRALEFIGLVEIIKGNTGGACIAEIDSQIALELLADFLYFKKLSMYQLTEARRLIEPYAAEIAATTITAADKKRLKDLIDQVRKEYDSGNYTKQLYNNDLEFHCVITNSTKNPLLMLMVDFIESLMSDAKSLVNMKKNMMLSILEAHERIYRAIDKGNAGLARQEMSKHIDEVEKHVLKNMKKDFQLNMVK
jgi:GntR family transcriptional regulator, transcriptional repressor for pyruvate dehydrogenase complex